jgi:hypothetical protein
MNPAHIIAAAICEGMLTTPARGGRFLIFKMSIQLKGIVERAPRRCGACSRETCSS